MKAYIIYVEHWNTKGLRISSRAYKNLDEAKKYIETRPDKPMSLFEGGWIYETADGKKRYYITDIEIV